MAVTPNLDHQMPRSVDVFDWIAKCARENKCSVWGCGKDADINSEKPVAEVEFQFPVPFCVEHAQGFRAANEAAKAGTLPEGLEPRNVRE